MGSALVLIAVALSGVVRSAQGAQDATPGAAATPCLATTPAENTELARRYWAEVWTAGGEAAVAELLAPDELHHWGLGGETTGAAAFTERLSGFLTAFPDIRFTVDQTVAEGDLVATRWTATGTHQGPFFGIAPTGRAFEYTGINIFRIACGKIAESWGEADHVGLRQQLGILPAPAATPAAPARIATPGASPAAGCPSAGVGENEALVRRWYDAVNSDNLDLLDDVLAVDAVQHASIFGLASGPEIIKRNLRSNRIAFADYRIALADPIAEGNLAAIRWSATGTHLGEFQGIAPTGRQVTWTGITLFRIGCGRIAEVWSEVDAPGRLQQIGGLVGTPTP